MQTSATPFGTTDTAPDTAGRALIYRAKAFFARRKKLGKAVLTVVVLNEIRGVMVVIAVLSYMHGGH